MADQMPMRAMDVEGASANWCAWRKVFEHVGDAQENLLLTDSPTFRKFLHEYSVSRTIRKGTSNDLREYLGSKKFPLSEMLQDVSGRSLDDQEGKLRGRFGTCDGRRSLRSAISKIASFLAPHTFVAWDKYALKGLKSISPKSKRPDCYATYLTELKQIMAGDIGKQILDVSASSPFANHNGFRWRVLDTYLMRAGGRWNDRNGG